MKNDKKEDDERPHFVDMTHPKNEPWKTNIYFGQRNGSGSHAHLVISGADLLFFRDMKGDIVVDLNKPKNHSTLSGTNLFIIKGDTLVPKTEKEFYEKALKCNSDEQFFIDALKLF